MLPNKFAATQLHFDLIIPTPQSVFKRFLVAIWS